MMPNVEVIVGTYEEYLLGYKLSPKEKGYSLVHSFADKSHAGALKCVATDGRYIATGSTDDRIFIYDMQSRKQTQILLWHEGTVNSLTFTPDGTHIFSGGADGSMVATRLGSWVKEAFWKKAHDGAAVTEISCHPSGKLALSLGSDLTVRTWNLIKGRIAYKTNLKSRHSLGRLAECVAWSPNGCHFTITGQRILEIWSIEKADVIKNVKTQARPNSLCWIDDECGILGMENGKLLWFCLNESLNEKKDIEITAHDNRVKAIAYLKGILATVSSSGEIKIWRVDMTTFSLNIVTKHNIGCRPTCLCILDLEPFGNQPTISIEKDIRPMKIEKLPETSNTKVRGVVTIEYENDEIHGNNAEKSSLHASKDKTKTQQKTKNSKRKSNEQSKMQQKQKEECNTKSKSSSDSEESDDLESDSDESHSDDALQPKKKRKSNAMVNVNRKISTMKPKKR